RPVDGLCKYSALLKRVRLASNKDDALDGLLVIGGLVGFYRKTSDQCAFNDGAYVTAFESPAPYTLQTPNHSSCSLPPGVGVCSLRDPYKNDFWRSGDHQRFQRLERKIAAGEQWQRS